MAKIPDRWLDYMPFKDPIKGTRILPMKTPLKECFNTGLSDKEMKVREIENGVSLENEFTPTQLMKTLDSKGLKLRLVVDLTNTQRYYNGRTFEDAGVEYFKLFCGGHEIPSNEIYKKFSDKLSRFLSKETDELVAVHCTHGINRTGYLICRYLIEHCGFETEDAIKRFADARGHLIERENYLEDLRKPLVLRGDAKICTGSNLDSSLKEERKGMELHDCSFKDKNQRRDYWMDLRRRGKEWRPERSAATDQVYNTRYDSDYEWERRFERHQVAGHVRYQSSKLSGHRIDDRYCTTGHEYRRRDHYTHPYYDYSYHYERRQPPQYGYYHYEGAGRSNGGYHQRQQFKDFFATESSRETMHPSGSDTYDMWCPKGKPPHPQNWRT